MSEGGRIAAALRPACFPALCQNFTCELPPRAAGLGFGLFKYRDGRIYKGNWKNGKQFGFGVLVLGDGEEIKGQWENGQLIDDALNINIDQSLG